MKFDADTLRTLGDVREIAIQTDAHPNAEINRRAAVEILREFGPAWRQLTADQN